MNLNSKIMAFAAIAFTCAIHAQAKNYTVTSPDEKITVNVSDDSGRLTYSVQHEGTMLLSPSAIGLDINGIDNARITGAKTTKGLTETVTAPLYRQKEFSTTANQLDIKLSGNRSVTFRIYNDGVAYRFSTSLKDKEIIINSETAEFNLPGDITAYLPYSTNDKKPMAMAFQNIYDVTPVSQAKDKLAFLPVTLDYGNGLKMTVLESDLRSYPGMWVKADTAALSLKGVFAPYPAKTAYNKKRHQEYVTANKSYIAKTEGARDYPWRILAITTDDRMMPVNNLVYALAEPSRVADPSWIRPGKVAWDWWNSWGLSGVPFKAGINTDTYKYFIDFAADNNIEYVVLDEGWYDSKKGDMMTVIPEIDLPGLIAYGKQRGVDIVLWTIFNVLDERLEEACAKYAGMGVKGFKVDFLDRDDQAAVDMTWRIAEAAARHNLILDYHGIYKPVGLNRTYPNVINFEGVFGMEEVKWTKIEKDMPRYDVTFPYIRMMAGPVDYTPGAMRNATKTDWKAVYHNPMSMGTRAHQLAAYIVHDSPFTMLCDAPTNYRGEEECVGFITSLPVTFDSTEIISGELGKYIVTMRRNGDSWFVAGMTDWDPRQLTLTMDFLPQGRDYKVTLITDGPNADKQASDYTVKTLILNHNSRLDIDMASGGGFAMRIDPQPAV